MKNNPVQPIFIMPENTQRTTGRDAQKTNIMAAKLVAETVRTTLGPKGMDKMIVDSLGDITVTNDGATIVDEINVEHPAAKMVVEVAKTQNEEVGDGTTTAVVLAGELLKNAEDLLDKEIHPTVLAKGYRQAAVKAQEILNIISEDVTEKDTDLLKKIAVTAMTGKGAEIAKEILADLVVAAVKEVIEKEDDKIIVDANDIKIEKKVGASINDSELIKGIILDKEKLSSEMPSYIKDAKIALIDSGLEIKSTEIDAKIQITSPEQMQAFLDQEEKMLKNIIDKVINSGCNVLFCQKGIDDAAQSFLAQKGIYAARRVKKTDIEKLSRATGARIVTNLADLSEKSLGKAGIVRELKVGDEVMTYVEECKNPKAVTLLVRGGTDHVVAEIKRAVEDAIGDIISALKVGKVVAGGGAVEIELANGLRKFADSLSGREQLAVNAFADSVEVIPRTLAENAGLDPIDILTELKAGHTKSGKNIGIDVYSGKVVDSWKKGVIEPLKIKTQAIKSASEVAEMILRIDDIIAGGKDKSIMPPPGPGGMPLGMGY